MHNIYIFQKNNNNSFLEKKNIVKSATENDFTKLWKLKDFDGSYLFNLILQNGGS